VRQEDGSSLWHIPVAFSTQGNASVEKFWMPQRRQLVMLINDLRADSYLLINVDRMGYFRVHYDDANWMLIAKELSRAESSSNISPISRAMLINDAAIFLANGSLSARIFLELIKHLEHDVRPNFYHSSESTYRLCVFLSIPFKVEYLPWLIATRNLHYMRWMLVDGSAKLSDDFKVRENAIYSLIPHGGIILLKYPLVVISIESCLWESHCN
jgi:hypothetical protein